MDNIRTALRPNTQKKYRQSQTNKGLMRFELQVHARAKARFEEMVSAAADEVVLPWDPRRRLAKARAQVFDEITQGITHEFFALKDQIAALKEEIKALSPSFFKTNQADQTPLPEAIRALPDEPQQLKALLANTYREAQQAKLAAKQYKRQADQYEELYETTSNYNDELKKQLKEQGVLIE